MKTFEIWDRVRIAQRDRMVAILWMDRKSREVTFNGDKFEEDVATELWWERWTVEKSLMKNWWYTVKLDNHDEGKVFPRWALVPEEDYPPNLWEDVEVQEPWMTRREPAKYIGKTTNWYVVINSEKDGFSFKKWAAFQCEFWWKCRKHEEPSTLQTKYEDVQKFLSNKTSPKYDIIKKKLDEMWSFINKQSS